MVGHHQSYPEHRFSVGFVPAWKGAPGVGGLELGGGDHLPGAVHIGEKGPIEAVQLIVECSGERHGQRGGAGRARVVEDDDRPLQVGLIMDRSRQAGSVRAHHGRLGDFQIHRVENHFGNRITDFQLYLDVSPESELLQVGLYPQVVAAGDHRSGEPIGVGGGHRGVSGLGDDQSVWKNSVGDRSILW